MVLEVCQVGCQEVDMGVMGVSLDRRGGAVRASRMTFSS